MKVYTKFKLTGANLGQLSQILNLHMSYKIQENFKRYFCKKVRLKCSQIR